MLVVSWLIIWELLLCFTPGDDIDSDDRKTDGLGVREERENRDAEKRELRVSARFEKLHLLINNVWEMFY